VKFLIIPVVTLLSLYVITIFLLFINQNFFSNVQGAKFLKEELQFFRPSQPDNIIRLGQVTTTIYEDLSKDAAVITRPHIHKNLHPKNLTVINITDFQFLINNDICNVTNISLVTIIHSAMEHEDTRNIIRETWGNPKIKDSVTRLVFILGKGSNEDLQKNITKESKKHGDIIQGDFIDVYHNISYKGVMANLWVSEFCEQAEFLVKTDDDQFVDLYEVYTLTRGYLNSSYYISNRFLMCPVWRTPPVIRDGKYAASYEDITDDLFPDFCTGWLWITNPGTAGQFVQVAPVIKHFWIDDVWITGYIAKHLKIEHQDCMEYMMPDDKQLLLYKSLQNPVTYIPDYITGPTNRERKISEALDTRARWCYTNKCNNNIYNKDYVSNDNDLSFFNIITKYFP